MRESAHRILDKLSVAAMWASSFAVVYFGLHEFVQPEAQNKIPLAISIAALVSAVGAYSLLHSAFDRETDELRGEFAR